MDKLLLRVNEAADCLGISRAKAYELLAGGVLPSIRVGGSIRVPLRDLELWIERNKEAAQAGEQGAATSKREEVSHAQGTRTSLRSL